MTLIECLIYMALLSGLTISSYLIAAAIQDASAQIRGEALQIHDDIRVYAEQRHGQL